MIGIHISGQSLGLINKKFSDKKTENLRSRTNNFAVFQLRAFYKNAAKEKEKSLQIA